MSGQSPYETIRFIHDAIKDRQDKNQQTFFNVKLERFGALTPLAVREPGANFYETVLQYLTRYDMSALIVELYSGKSHNVKEAFQTFKINLKKGIELTSLSVSEQEPKITPAETVITTEKHFFTMAEKERQVMMLEFDIKRLQYENEELKKKNKKKKKYIEALEADMSKTEKDKKNSLGNVSLGLAGANALEGFAKSSVGIGIMKFLGAKEETINGMLGIEQTAKDQPVETKTTASIISSPAEKAPETKEEKIRSEIKKFITEFMNSTSDTTLRLYYELMQYLGADNEVLSSVVANVKAYRETQKSTPHKQTNNSVPGAEKNDSPVNGQEDEDDINDSS